MTNPRNTDSNVKSDTYEKVEISATFKRSESIWWESDF